MKTASCISPQFNSDYAKHREKRKAQQRAYYERNREAINERRRAYQRSYRRVRKTGWTPDEYDAAHERQGGRCAICGEKPDQHGLRADHCHATQKTRELLCNLCNAGLGQFRDNPALLRAAATYLEKHR